MSDITYAPTQDGYETELTEVLTNSASDLEIHVRVAPEYTPTSTPTKAVLNPGKTNAELVKVSDYNPTTKILTIPVGGRAQPLYKGHVATPQQHGSGSIIMISDNSDFWDEIKTAVNSKANTASPAFTGSMKVPVYATTAARDLGIPVPENGMEVYVTADGMYYDYTAGSWLVRAAGGTFPNASTTVAGKVEVATDAETIAGTGTGGTGAFLAVTPANLLSTTVSVIASAGIADAQKFARLGANGYLVKSMVEVLKDVNPTVTGVALNTMTAGPTSDASAFHTHSALLTLRTAIAFEAVSAAGKPLALRPITVEYFTQLGTPVTSALGDSNVRRRYTMKFVQGKNYTGNDTLKFMAGEQVNGATTLGNLTVSIQTDSAGQPSGTPVTNATSTISQATQRTWNTTIAERTATPAGSYTLVKGTTYHYVVECAATDATNYLKFGDASAFDENFLTFTRLTYNLDTASWGNSTTVTPLYFWFGADVTGFALCNTDANYGGRTWTFKGFSSAAASAGADLQYYIDGVPNMTLTPNTEYWLDTTPGGITTTKPDALYGNDFAYKIGETYEDGTFLKIVKGPKYIDGQYDPNASGTTFRIVTWFKISYMSGVATRSGQDELAEGVYDGTNQFCVSFDGGVGGSLDNAKFFRLATSSFAGTLSAATAGGITLTFDSNVFRSQFHIEG